MKTSREHASNEAKNTGRISNADRSPPEIRSGLSGGAMPKRVGWIPSRVMIRSLIVLFMVTSSASLFGFDPEDDTFDPSVKTVVADGSTRLGDPSPFIREGYEERGFTHVQASKPEGSDPIVQVSFLKMPAADDPARALGGAMFLSVETADTFATLLAKGALLEEPTEVWNTEWAGRWTISFQEEKGVVLEQAMNGQVARYILSVPAAKKLAGAVGHFSKEAKKL